MYMRRTFHRTCLALMVCVLFGILCGCDDTDKELLPSWNDSSVNKQAIINFVRTVTDEKSDGYVPAENRIATFDMDGTIVVEKQVWLELAVAVHRIDNELSNDKDLVAEKDRLLEYIAMDPEPAATGQLIVDVTGKAFEGMPQEDFVAYMNRFMLEEKPDFPGLAYKDCFYKPMLELIQYLRDNDFTVYIVSGSERGVVWGAASEAVNLPRSQMIGADITLKAKKEDNLYDESGDSMFQPHDVLIRDLGFTQSSVNMDKVYNIFHQIGIQPIFACGNTDGDFSMLNYAKYNPDYHGLAVLIKHDDDEREYLYNTEEQRGDWYRLAQQYGWNVVSMKDEFNTVFLKKAEKIAE